MDNLIIIQRNIKNFLKNKNKISPYQIFKKILKNKFEKKDSMTKELNNSSEINFGDFAGLTSEEGMEKFPKEAKLWLESPSLLTFPNGENLRDIQYRGRAALEDAVAKYPGKTIFIGAHSRLNTTIICSMLGIDLEHFWQVPQSNTCVNVLKYKDGVWTVEIMNSVAHLGKLIM